MVFAFSLPSTSHFSFPACLHSDSHPYLPHHASTARHALRVALKKHKRLSSSQQVSHLSTVLAALNEYIPFLLTISRGLEHTRINYNENEQHLQRSSRSSSGDVDIVLQSEIAVEWRPTLSSVSTLRFLRRNVVRGESSGTGFASTRVKGQGIEFEIAFVLLTLASVLSLLARVRYLTTMYARVTPTTEERATAVQSAVKNLLQASSIHSYLATVQLYSQGDAVGDNARIDIPDLDPSTQSALSTLALCEATLLAVLKDDAFTSVCIQSRNKHDTEWMVKAPDIPKVRTLLFARLCVRAAEYAEQSAASAGAVKSNVSSIDRRVDEELLSYMSLLAKSARAKACRFLGIDAEMAGKVAEAIAWLRAGQALLGSRSMTTDDKLAESDSTRNKRHLGGGFSKLKREWSSRKEERKVEKELTSSSSKSSQLETDIDYGDDAGRDEELAVIEMLERQWVKMNDTINTETIPPWSSLVSNLPSGRDIHSPPGPYVPPDLDAEQLERMRGPPGVMHDVVGEENSSGEEEIDDKGRVYF